MYTKSALLVAFKPTRMSRVVVHLGDCDALLLDPSTGRILATDIKNVDKQVVNNGEECHALILSLQ